MSAAMVVVPAMWAGAAVNAGQQRGRVVRVERAAVSVAALGTEWAFYRKYTEGMLRRYLRMRMESGRVPSLLGREMFRGRVTSYRIRSFEDVVIFVHDVERCLKRLEQQEWRLLERIALQEYSQGETAELLGISLRTVVRRYGAALDRLTGMFLETGLMEPFLECMGGCQDED